MFGTIRRHQSWLWGIIITLTIISFVIYFDPSQRGSRGRSRGGGGGTGPHVNGKTITARMYAEAEREVKLLYFLNFRKWPDQDHERAQQIGFDIESQAYLRMFRVGKAEELGVHVSDRAISALVNRLLGEDPKIDQFAKEILQPAGLTADDFERFVIHDATIQQLSSVVGAAGRMVTPAEAETLYRRDHQEMSGDIVFFHLSNYLSKVVITNGALTNWYALRQADYRIPDKVRVSYVEFAKTNFLADADKQFATITNLDFQLRELYFKSGTNSFKDTNGNVLSETAALAKIKEDQRERSAFGFAVRKANEFANRLYDKPAQRAENLDAVAKEENVPVQVSEAFDRTGPTNLDVSPKFAEIAFNLDPTNNPISFQPIPGENGIYLIALKETIPGRPQSFEEVRDKVTDDFSGIL